jgi:chaperonin cofactor prefoldin
MATVIERVSVLETKVDNIEERIDDIKRDIKDMHDCLDNTRDSVISQLNLMTAEYRSNAAGYYEHAEKLNQQQTAQHNELAKKMSDIEKSKAKLMLYGAIGAAFVAGAGWSGAINFPMIIKFFGL